jgi:hypothetical protein
MKIADILIVLLILGFVFFFFLHKPQTNTNLYLFVKTSQTQKTYKLNQYKKITNQGPLGKSILVISNNFVFMQSSPCPQQICVHEGKINKANQSIICIPNRIEATILSSNSTEVDSVAK